MKSLLAAAPSALLFCLALWPLPAPAQTAQVGADASAESNDALEVAYVHYRPARWEDEKVEEYESEHTNQGGLVYIYLRNNKEEPVRLRFWRMNHKDESYWILNYFASWHRVYHRELQPGQMTVLEINGISEDFAEGKPFLFHYVDGSYRPAVRVETVLREDPVRISFIRVLPGMQALEVHVRHTGGAPLAIGNATVAGKTVTEQTWVGNAMDGPGHAIGRLQLDAPLQPSELIVLGINVEQDGAVRTVHAHRRAFEDAFPIGVWSGRDDTYAVLRRMHIDTIVRGGAPEDPFYSETVPKYGLRTMVHTGHPVNVDMVRALSGHPAVRCWMIQDEPDWSIPANIMVYAENTVRHFDKTIPSFITLCRNIKFFEYAPIADIPCQDHYSVTAPSSSKWPKFYGTRLEETAYYTRDLKEASEPKPIWIWTQGIAGWDERPKRPVPTPNELAAQLVFNLGRGAKGILWFNYAHDIAEEFPDARVAMREWGRVMELLRQDWLASEPANLGAEAPDKVDVATLLSMDRIIVCLTNTDYEIHPEAYPFAAKKQVAVSLELPSWFDAQSAARVGPGGVTPLTLNTEGKRASFQAGDLEATGIVMLDKQPDAARTMAERFEEIVARESKTF